MERVQAYRTFKKLQEKGFIEATLERPTRFTVVPFINLLETFIETKKSEVENLNKQKEGLMESWRNVSMPESDYTVAKFSIISGKRKIHAKMLSMIEEAQKGIFVLTTSLGVIQEDLGGIFEAIIENYRKRELSFKIIADITKDNFRIMDRMSKGAATGNQVIEVRHLNLNTKYFPRFLIKDEEEAILYASSGDDASILNIEDEGLWINDKMFISILKAFFSQMWQVGIEANRRIDEIKTGVPIGETTVIKNPTEAWQKIQQLLENAKEDVILITSSQSLNILKENDPLSRHHKRGLRVRLMAPLDLDNLEAAKKLSANYQIKHVPINYMTMMLIDDRNLFMFKSPPINDTEDSTYFFFLPETFYTNDQRSIERVSEMLNDTWKRGTEISEILAQAEGLKLPETAIDSNENMAKLINIMIQKNATSTLITQNGSPIGIITDRKILKEIAEDKKNPETTLTKDLDFTPILTLTKNQTMTDALKISREKATKRTAVVKDGQLIGMLT